MAKHSPNELIDEVIENASEVMDSLASEDAKERVNCRGRSLQAIDQFVPAQSDTVQEINANLVLHTNGIVWEADLPSNHDVVVELADVLIGPLNLFPASLQRKTGF